MRTRKSVCARSITPSTTRAHAAISAFQTLYPHGSGMLSYLSYMAERLAELRRLLKTSGCVYLHCDPTASHYLKILMDVIFGAKNFRNEVVWSYRRWPAKQKNFQKMHDTILRYANGAVNLVWNQPYGTACRINLASGRRAKDSQCVDETGKRKRGVKTGGNVARRADARCLEYRHYFPDGERAAGLSDAKTHRADGAHHHRIQQCGRHRA